MYYKKIYLRTSIARLGIKKFRTVFAKRPTTVRERCSVNHYYFKWLMLKATASAKTGRGQVSHKDFIRA